MSTHVVFVLDLVVERSHRIDSQLPVFVASGYAEDPVMAAPKDHGFAGSICKPFTRIDLAEMFRRSKEERAER